MVTEKNSSLALFAAMLSINYVKASFVYNTNLKGSSVLYIVGVILILDVHAE